MRFRRGNVRHGISCDNIRGPAGKKNASVLRQRRGCRGADLAGLQDSRDFSYERKFLGARSTASGITLGRTSLIGGECGRCPQQEQTSVTGIRCERGVFLAADGAEAAPRIRKQTKPKGGNFTRTTDCITAPLSGGGDCPVTAGAVWT